MTTFCGTNEIAAKKLAAIFYFLKFVCVVVKEAV